MVWLGCKKPWPLPIKEYMKLTKEQELRKKDYERCILNLFKPMIWVEPHLAWHRMTVQAQEMNKQYSNIKRILHYWSDTTCECYAIPIFTSDGPMDIVNRYFDLFPAEAAQFVAEVKDTNDNLLHSNGMSKEQLQMLKIKVPLIVYKAMEEINPAFWQGKDGMKWFEQNIKQFKVGR